jgi:hypothetical protein
MPLFLFIYVCLSVCTCSGIDISRVEENSIKFQFEDIRIIDGYANYTRNILIPFRMHS